MKRYYQQISTRHYLKRVDGNSPLTGAEAQVDAAKEYKLSADDIRVIEDPDEVPNLASALAPPQRPGKPTWGDRYRAADTLERRLGVLAKMLGLETDA